MRLNFDVGEMPENTCEKQAKNINEDLGQMSCHDKLYVSAEKQGMDLEDPVQIRQDKAKFFYHDTQNIIFMSANMGHAHTVLIGLCALDSSLGCH